MMNAFVMSWWPVYIEPIVDSGERVCVAICYQKGEKIFYKKILRNDLREAIFLSKGLAIDKISKYACEYFCYILQCGEVLNNNSVSISGMYLGEKGVVEGYDDDEIHQRIVRKVSFFSDLEFYDANSKQSARKEDGLIDLVEKDLVAKNSPLVSCLRREVKVLGGNRKYDFANSRAGCAVNFHQIRKGSRNSSADGKCLSLSMLGKEYPNVCLAAVLDGQGKLKEKLRSRVSGIKGVAQHLNVGFEVFEDRRGVIEYLERQALSV